MKFKKQNQNGETKICIVRGCRSFVHSCNFTLIKLIRILLKWKYIQDKNYVIFWRYVAKAKLFCLKSFVPVTQAGVFKWENFYPDYRDLGNRASPASQMNTSKFLRRKEWRGEISQTEPARPVNRADMKRPSLWVSRGSYTLKIYFFGKQLCGTVLVPR